METSKEIKENFSQKSAEERVCIIVDSYFCLSETKLKTGEPVPDHLKELFYGWLHDPKIGHTKDEAMMRALVKEGAGSADPFSEYRREACYPIDEVSEMLGVNPWTVLMWVNRFGPLTPQRDSEGKHMFTPADVGRIGKICRMIKIRGITSHDIMKHLVYNGEAGI